MNNGTEWNTTNRVYKVEMFTTTGQTLIFSKIYARDIYTAQQRAERALIGTRWEGKSDGCIVTPIKED